MLGLQLLSQVLVLWLCTVLTVMLVILALDPLHACLQQLQHGGLAWPAAHKQRHTMFR